MSLPRSRQFFVSVIAGCAVLTLSVFAKSESQAPAQAPPQAPPPAAAGQAPRQQGGRALNLPLQELPRTAEAVEPAAAVARR